MLFFLSLGSYFIGILLCLIVFLMKFMVILGAHPSILVNVGNRAN